MRAARPDRRACRQRGAPHDSVRRSQGAVPAHQARNRRRRRARARDRPVRARRRSRGLRARVRRRTAAPRAASPSTPGTSALHLALLAAGVGPGDEVDHRPVHVRRHRRRRSATPAPRRCSSTSIPATFTMDVTRIEAAITPRTKAILPVHLYGQPADMDPILEIAAPPRPGRDRRRLPGARRALQGPAGRRARRRSAASASIRARTWAPTARAARSRPTARTSRERSACCATGAQEKKYHHVLKGYNYRMEGLQGAILRVKLRRLPEWTERPQGQRRRVRPPARR